MVSARDSFNIQETSKGFSIGDVSRITDIPAETIRYLENLGLVSPKRKEMSTHRRYDDVDVGRLIDYRVHRQAGIPTQETVDLLISGGLADYIDSVGAVLPNVRQKARFYERFAWRTEEYLDALRMAAHMPIGKCEMSIRPEYFCYLQAYFKDNSGQYKQVRYPNGTKEENFEMLLFSWPLFRLYKESFEQKNFDLGLTQWFGFTKEWAQLLPQIAHLDTTHVTPVPALRAILRIAGDEDLTDVVNTTFFSYMEEHNQVLDGDVWGRVIVVAHEDNTEVRYCETWVPVKELEQPAENPTPRRRRIQ